MDETTTGTATPTVAPAAEGETLATATTSRRSMKRWYILTAFLVVLIIVGVWFMLERDGRLQTGVFDGAIAALKQRQAAAVVNGVEISVSDFESNLRQLSVTVEQQGADPTDPAVVADLRTQAIDSLVNTELLRQEAVENDITVTDEEVETRYTAIAEGIGGTEALAAKMAELGVTEDMLRRDIRNDILIQAHLEKAVDLSVVSVTEEEMQQLYDQATAAMETPPAFAEVRDQVEQQIRFGKEQELVANYVATLRGGAEVELKI